MVETGGLENRCTRKGTGGSNPSLSAITYILTSLRRPDTHTKSLFAEAANQALIQRADGFRLAHSLMRLGCWIGSSGLFLVERGPSDSSHNAAHQTESIKVKREARGKESS